VRQGISASDLIAALSSIMGGQESADAATSGESSGVCSVPACTPKEGLNEWLRLGIHPDEVIQALTALTISRAEQEVDGEEVEPIRVTVPTQLVTKYEEFPPSVVVSDADKEGANQNGGNHQEKEENSITEKDQATTIEDQGAEQKEEQGVGLEAKLGERELVGDVDDSEKQEVAESTAPVKIEGDLTLPSDEAMGIQLLNDLSFFPDPLASAVSEPITPITEPMIKGSPPNNDIDSKETNEKEDAVPSATAAVEHKQFEPSSSPLEESVLYLES
jgi:hypothetical protein